MKKYSFRLQPVLDIREKVLEDKRLEMAQVIQLLNDQQEGLERLIAKQASYKEELERNPRCLSAILRAAKKL